MIRAGQTGDRPVPYLLTAQGRAATATRRRASLARVLGLTPADGAPAPRPLTGPPALDPCPAYVNVTGPEHTMHTIYCTEPYGHADLDETPLHFGTLYVLDRFNRSIVASVSWAGQ